MTRQASSVEQGHSDVLRCPGCGQRISPTAPSQCSLCGYDFVDTRATGTDVTPYARAFASRKPGWRVMLTWVWYARFGRLKHIALMRTSAASRRFARFNILWLALAVGLFQTSRVGWRWVTISPAVEETGSIEPAGSGWLHIASAPRPLPRNHPAEDAVDLWWNPSQAVMGAASALLTAGPLVGLWLAMLRFGARRAHAPAYRHEDRLSAAIDYSSAWVVVLIPPLLLGATRCVVYIAAINQWAWQIPRSALESAAGALGAFGLAMWWFWLYRLAMTAPARTRARVAAFFGVGAPLLAAVLAAVWLFGLDAMYRPLSNVLGLQF